MWRSGDEWLPRRIAHSEIIVVEIPSSDGRLRPPKVVRILRVPAGNARVACGEIEKCKHASFGGQIEVTCKHNLRQHVVPNGCRRCTPESRDLTLQSRTSRAHGYA